jgi:D-3-phosphoglycerate dehydrogenase
MQRVLLTDNIAEEAVRVFDSYEGIEAVRIDTPSPDELLSIIPDYDALIVRSPTKVTSEVIERGVKLEYIGRAGVGVDNIDVDAATRCGIVVMNSPGGNTVSTAEHTIAVMLAVARRIPHAHRSLTGGEWDRKTHRGVELCGKTLGVVGLGRVGRAVAERMRAFGMRVVAADPYVSAADAEAMGVDLETLDEVLRASDWITVHVPLASDTKGMIGRAELARMKDGVVVVNCARGGVVDEDALVDALASGKVAAVGLDVYQDEPPGDHPLFAHPMSVFTPHIGAATVEAQLRVATDVAEAVAEALTRGVLRDAVNAPNGRPEGA